MDDYIHRPLKYISITDVDILCQVGLRYPMCLCTCVNEEGGTGRVCTQKRSLLSYTLEYISLADVDILFQVGLR